MSRPRVYAAHPRSCYGTAHEAACLARTRELLDGCEIVDPHGRYATDAGWLAAWPRVLRCLDGLVLFAASDGTIGTGCLREVGDALACGLGLAVLDGGELHEIGALSFVDRSCRTPGRVAVPLASRAYAPDEFASFVDTLHRRRTRRKGQPVTDAPTSTDRDLIAAVRIFRRAHDDGPTWSEIARAVGRPTREATRDIRRLVHKGWLAADSTTRSLDVGPKFLDLLTRYSNGESRPSARKDMP